MPLPALDCSTGGRWGRRIGFGAVLGLLSILLQWGISHIHHAPIQPFHFSQPLWLWGILIVVIAPFIEEWVFRGLVQTWLLKYMSVFLAIFISTSLFTAAHLQYSRNIPALLSVFLLGLLYSTSRYMTGSLIPNIIAHAMVNLAAILQIWQ